jgi:RNA polymerase sigma-70 factor, ECF subfamily
MTRPAQTSSGKLQLPELEGHRAALLGIARLQLRNPAHAEDVVQETLLAAVKGADGFAGGSSVRTWLVGILKHKIVDHIRRASRERPLESLDRETSLDDLDALFKDDGHYVEMPADWGDPEAALSQRKFFEALERCLGDLPKNTGRVFVMREVMGVDTGQICKDLGITATNCWVLLHRARMHLRICLERNWFGRAAREGST